jgi:hypothetical protein
MGEAKARGTFEQRKKKPLNDKKKKKKKGIRNI